MIHLNLLALIFSFSLLSYSGQAQEVLPDFRVRELSKGKIQISWNNPFVNCIQLSIQRSSDSTKDFRTIFSTQSPELPVNGYVDSKQSPFNKRYYRIFYVLNGGAYFFSKSMAFEIVKVNEDKLHLIETIYPKEVVPLEKSAGKEQIKIYFKNKEVFILTRAEYMLFRDSINHKTKDGLHKINDHAIEWKPAKALKKKETLISIYKKNVLLLSVNNEAYIQFKDSIKFQTKDTLFEINQWQIVIHPFIKVEKKIISIYKKDTLVAKMELSNYKRFKDSIIGKTKDTLFSRDELYTEIHPFVPKFMWKPSLFIFTNPEGNVSILLPLVKQHKYRIIFYDEDLSELFQIKTVKESELILEKLNFMHSGWFSFELFEDEKLKEKDKFFLAKN